ncbi:MAG: glycosyltransferase family 4 protein [Candidatus Omnitrophica bacterium]|nr:glycosyltransferase family 4 protein [Candidatus Omnitrophota bacterium]
MRIGLDVYPLSRQNLTGLGVYLNNLLRELSDLDKENEYLLYSYRDFELPFKNPLWKKRIIGGPKVISSISTLWLAWGAKKMLAEDKIDVFLGTQNFIPLGLPPSIKKVLVIHDLAIYACPQNVPASLYLPHRLIFPRSLFDAQRIVAISKSSRADLKKFFPEVDERRVSTVYYGGPDPGFNPCPKKEARDYILERFGVPDKFILSVTSLEWRKNVVGLLRAFDLFRKKFGLPYKLLIAGAERRAKASEIERLYNELNLKDSVYFLGHLNTKELNYLYNAGEGLVFPSFYEGFGLPPLEAMACATPVLASDIPVFRELFLDSVLFANPHEPTDIADNIYRLLTEEPLRTGLIQKGRERIPAFSWKETSSQMLDIFNSLR